MCLVHLPRLYLLLFSCQFPELLMGNWSSLTKHKMGKGKSGWMWRALLSWKLHQQGRVIQENCMLEWARHTVHLFWLRVPQRTEFHLVVLVHCCLNGTATPYRTDELRRNADIESRKRIRSASTAQLDVPWAAHKNIGDRAFPVAAATVWKGLPPMSRYCRFWSHLDDHRRRNYSKDH